MDINSYDLKYKILVKDVINYKNKTNKNRLKSILDNLPFGIGKLVENDTKSMKKILSMKDKEIEFIMIKGDLDIVYGVFLNVTYKK